MSEPDLATLRTLANIFNISMDEFLDIRNNEPIIREEIVVNKYMCDECKDVFSKDELHELGNKTTCLSCHNKKIKKIKYEYEKNTLKYLKLKPFIKGAIVGLVIYFVGFLLFLFDKNYSFLESLYMPLALAIIIMVVVSQLFYDSALKEIIWFFTGRSFRMPGLIFELSLDGIIWLILVKIFLYVASIIISVLIFLFGLVVGLIISPFTYLIGLIKAISFSQKQVI